MVALCSIASGDMDAFVHVSLNPWDYAAGQVIVEEAGGKLTDFSGTPLTLMGLQNLATNGLIHKEMLNALKPFSHLR